MELPRELRTKILCLRREGMAEDGLGTILREKDAYTRKEHVDMARRLYKHLSPGARARLEADVHDLFEKADVWERYYA